jgi:hypothetical protein
MATPAADLVLNSDFDPFATVKAFVTAHRAGLSVRSSLVRIELWMKDGNDFCHEIGAVPLCIRLFDLKMRLLSFTYSAKAHAYQLHFLQDGRQLDDTQCLSRYSCGGVVPLQIARTAVRSCMVRLSNVEGRSSTVIVNLTKHPDWRIGEFAPLLSKDQLSVGFESDGQPLLRSTLLASESLDPTLHLCAVLRRPAVPVQFPELRQSFAPVDVTLCITVGDLYPILGRLFPELKTFQLLCGEKECEKS